MKFKFKALLSSHLSSLPLPLPSTFFLPFLPFFPSPSSYFPFSPCSASFSPPPTWSSLDSCSDALSSELQLDFTRTMNRILFDKTITSQPGTFPFVTLPDPHIETVPQSGGCIVLCVDLVWLCGMMLLSSLPLFRALNLQFVCPLLSPSL